jgi:hypothetical protein
MVAQGYPGISKEVLYKACFIFYEPDILIQVFFCLIRLYVDIVKIYNDKPQFKVLTLLLNSIKRA